MRRTAETQARVESTQKGRQAMDAITRSLRSQVCLSASVPSMAAASDTSMTYYSDRGDPTATTVEPPEKHVVTYDPATRRLTQEIYPGTGAPPTTTYPSAPAQRKQLAENVALDGATPMFRLLRLRHADPADRLAGPARPRGRRRPRPDRAHLDHVRRARRGRHRLVRHPRGEHLHQRRVRPRRGSQRPSSLSDMRMNLISRTRSPARRRVGLLHAGGDDRHDRRHDVRRRRLRRGQRGPAAQPQLAGPQGDVRRGRGGTELLPVPSQRGQRLLDEVHQRRRAEREREQPREPGVAQAAERDRSAQVAQRRRLDRAVHDRAAAGLAGHELRRGQPGGA